MFTMIVLSALLGLFGLLVFYVSRLFKASETKDVIQEEHVEEEEELKKKGKGNVQSRRKAAPNDKKGTNAKDKFTHPWLLTTLKGHSGRVFDLDLSENGKYLASCSEDRSVLVWTVKDFAGKEHRMHRGNVTFDMASKVKWSPDSKAYIVHKASENCAEVYRLNRKEEGGGFGAVQSVVVFPSHHVTDVIGLGFASTGKFVMTCSDKTSLVIWSIRGDILAEVDTYQMSTYCAKVSPCGRFVATSGFTPDVKVWEVKFNRAGDFEKIQRAFELKGHSSGVFHFDFNCDSSRMATLGKDNTWQLYDTKVDFDRGQDPSCLQKGVFEGADKDSVVALSPDAKVLVVGHRFAVTWFSTETGKVCGTMDQVHGDRISCLLFDKEGRWLLSAGDKHIRVFHNVPGFRSTLAELEEKVKKATTEGMRERLQQQTEELRAKLKGLNSSL